MKTLEKVYLHKPQSRDNLYKSGYYYPAKHADAEIARLKALMLEAGTLLKDPAKGYTDVVEKMADRLIEAAK